MKLVKVCIAMAVFAALFVVPPMASAIKLEAPTGTIIPNGTNLVATNVAHAGTAKHIQMSTPIGNLTCDIATLTGPLLTNNVSSPVWEISTAQIEGPTPGSSCTGPLGALTVTPSHSSPGSLPWCAKFTNEDVVAVYGKPPGGCHSAETRPLTLTLHTGGLVCGYEKASMTATYTTHPADAVMTFNNQTFKRTAGSSAFCPSEIGLKTAFTLTLDPSGKHEGPVFITP